MLSTPLVIKRLGRISMAWFIISCILCTSCGIFEHPSDEAEPYPIWKGGEYALHLPHNSQVKDTSSGIEIDIEGGWRWMDVSWHDSKSPASVAQRWGIEQCRTILWDTPYLTPNTRWAAGGLCTIQYRRYWVIVTSEKFNNRVLLSTYTADFERTPYEQAWVEYLQTMLTLSPGTTPLPSPSTSSLKKLIRDAAKMRTGRHPIPGGGDMSTQINRKLIHIWDTRDDFVFSKVPSEPTPNIESP